MQDAFLVFLNIFLVGGSGMWGNAHWMDQVFKRRHSLVVFWGYFCVKTVVMFFFQYEMASGSAPWAQAANNIYVSVTAILTTVAVVYTWKGVFAQIFLCAFACDMMNSALLTACVYGVRALILGLIPSDEWLLIPLNLGTITAVIVFTVLHLALTKPIVALLSIVNRMVMRREVLWTVVTWVFVIAESMGTAWALNSNTFLVDLQCLVVLLLLSVLLLVVLGRAVRYSKRGQAVAACEELAREYDAKVRAQLEELERGRTALAGHEQVLAAIGSSDAAYADDGTVRQVRELEAEFRRLRAGSYCDMPALDAVLCAGADHLGALGAHATLTVAGVDEDAPVPVTTVYSLLGLACDVADRQRSVEGDAVDLRIRKTGDELSLGLEVPKRWGRLGARRRLASLEDEKTVLVRESVEGDRRQVLMVCQR